MKMYDIAVPQKNYKKYAIVSGCLMLGGIAFSIFIFPTVLDAAIRFVSFPFFLLNNIHKR